MALRTFLFALYAFYTLSTKADTYAIYLKDKSGSAFSIYHPEDFLSKSAIARRIRQNIPITETDLPVSSTYLTVLGQYATQVNYALKWLNCVVLDASETDVLKIKQLPFVVAVNALKSAPKSMAKTDSKFETLVAGSFADFDADEYYGSATVQNQMIHVDFLHKRGFKGDGVIVGHFDNGCFNAQNIIGFDSLLTTARFIGARDIVDGNENVFNDGTHGTSTLSCLAANSPGKMVGTSPNASFFLLRTEENGAETLQEEYNWAYGAEVADSIGAEVFSTSLGYTTFDGNVGNHTYSDLTGNKTPITIASNIAARLGIIVLNSAGNEGAKPWYYIGAPADADSILAIGAVDGKGEIAKFSSFGPNASGRVKPDVCAQGAGTAVFDAGGQVMASNGTSFSCPVMAGGAVCLRQAYPSVSNLVIMDAIRKSAHLFKYPTNQLGYGIPDLAVAYFLIDDYLKGGTVNSERQEVFPIPFQKELNVFVQQPNEAELIAELYDFSGRLALTQVVRLQNNPSQLVTINAENLNAGAYLLRIRGAKYYDIQRVEKR
ncbi:MAG: S8 family peptidase [Chitinophagales bacterium]|nr:S8 family peptidase [Chitinophagales bacterium]